MSEFEGKDVLLVDDDDDIIETLEAALEELNVNIRCTGNGNEAVRMVQEKVPDLLVLDQMLPGRSGFIILENIRSIRKDSGKPPIIMITANPGSRHKVYAETLGVDIYLNKPFRMERFIDAVTSLLSKEETE